MSNPIIQYYPNGKKAEEVYFLIGDRFERLSKYIENYDTIENLITSL